jgi:DNA transformation protein
MVPKHDGFRDFVLDQLSGLPGLTCRAMFGGYGLYQREIFFGIIHKGRLYLKTNRVTAPRYRDRGMKPFKPTSTQTLKNYYEVPVEVLEDSDGLTTWASQAAQG